MDSLPFPVASILWIAKTLKDQPQRRYAQLDYFFEGLAEYLAILLLSAARRDPAFMQSHWVDVSAALKGAHLSLSRASFGTWVSIFECLAKRIRTEIGTGPESRETWQRRSACDDRDFLGVLVSKELVDILKRANKRRNDWRGHGGVVGDDEAIVRSNHLEDLVLEVKDLIGHRWASYPMVIPGRSIFTRGLHLNTASVVVGTRTPFDQREFALLQPMEDSVLHVVGPESGEVCPLLPLISISASPADEKNACYFFNRIDAGQVRFVSYHFERRPERTEPMSVGLRSLVELIGGG